MIRRRESPIVFPHKMPWDLLRPTVNYILAVQEPSGGIPWFKGGKLDPWDHVEALMGLTIGGEFAAAKRGYDWLLKNQLPDGSWYSHYEQDVPQNTHHREIHFVAYVAVGLWHYAVVTADWDYVREWFPALRNAIAFVLRYQTSDGDIHWAVNAEGVAQEDALITACASIYKSLQCAIFIAQSLGEDDCEWVIAYQKLGEALREKPWRFDRTWEPKTRFSMDWFYPVLSGVYKQEEARVRLASRWQDFVYPPFGCRCVSDEPWVTIAESCELILALNAVGEKAQALAHFQAIFQLQDHDGGFWTGINYRDDVIWPEEKTAWTAGAALMAADAIFEFTDAAQLFCLEGGVHSILREN